MKDVSGDWPAQHGFDVRFDWGPQGVERLAPHVRAVVIVDVLRFTTAVETACAGGVAVFPYRWKDASAAEFAASIYAILGGASGGPSLSPQSLRGLAAGASVVLPSPNGAACSLLAAEAGATVAAGCLRNASAVATWLTESTGRPLGILACGELWRDGSIRPALEDLLGAGAIISRLGGLALSPEAEAAAAAFEGARDRLVQALRDCASGRELVELQHADDIPWCAALDVSNVVPVLRDGAYRCA
ncbi:MAG TPA: 2-phosphosulfolactate phosphatase [Dehalococcoidia bacterium]|nr:2-phosphosulfolactate phosphatase [Dehalococcoidia bacterium]